MNLVGHEREWLEHPAVGRRVSLPQGYCPNGDSRPHRDAIVVWMNEEYFGAEFIDSGEYSGACVVKGQAELAAHDRDEDCTVDATTDSCTTCGVTHGEPCSECGARAYHRTRCSQYVTV